jgi:hypothetical protein
MLRITNDARKVEFHMKAATYRTAASGGYLGLAALECFTTSEDQHVEHGVAIATPRPEQIHFYPARAYA